MGRESQLADEPTSPDPFDVRTIRHLVNLMTRHDLSEIDLRQGEHRIRLRRGPRSRSAPPLPNAAAAHEPPAPLPQSAATPAPAPASNLVDIKSPTVGTFYAQP